MVVVEPNPHNAPHNAATRVAACLDRVAASAARLAPARPALSALAVWADAFRVSPEAPDTARRREVARNLLLVADEVDIIERCLSSRPEVPAAVYAPMLARVRDGIDVAHLARPWAEVEHRLRAGAARAYLRDTAAVLLGAQDAASAPEVLDRLRAQLADIVLESHATAGLPAPLRTFVLQVADSLTRALRDYDIVGEAAIRREVERLLWEWAHVERRTRKGRAWPTIAKVGVVLATAAGLVSNVERLLEAGLKLPALVRELRADLHNAGAVPETPDTPDAMPPPSSPHAAA